MEKQELDERIYEAEERQRGITNALNQARFEFQVTNSMDSLANVIRAAQMDFENTKDLEELKGQQAMAELKYRRGTEFGLEQKAQEAALTKAEAAARGEVSNVVDKIAGDLDNTDELYKIKRTMSVPSWMDDYQFVQLGLDILDGLRLDPRVTESNARIEFRKRLQEQLDIIGAPAEADVPIIKEQIKALDNEYNELRKQYEATIRGEKYQKSWPRKKGTSADDLRFEMNTILNKINELRRGVGVSQDITNLFNAFVEPQ